MSTLEFTSKKGSAIAELFDDLAKLRIAVFREYPYLYEGSVDYEREYLQTYFNSSDSFLFAVYDGTEMIGATTCIPLKDETEEVQEPFIKAGMNLEDIFYFGESILLPTYRGNGLGHRFFREREGHVAQFGTYKMTCFCAVDRGNSHPAKPADYRPHDEFWTKKGYQKHPKLKSLFEWTDVGESLPTKKEMIYWYKLL